MIAEWMWNVQRSADQLTRHVYNQNIKLVCNSDTLKAELGQENVLYTPPNTQSMVDRLSFFIPRRPKLLQIGQTRHQSAPLYVYIKLDCNSGTLCARLGQENVLYIQLNTESMVNSLNLWDQNYFKLVSISCTLCVHSEYQIGLQAKDATHNYQQVSVPVNRYCMFHNHLPLCKLTV